MQHIDIQPFSPWMSWRHSYFSVPSFSVAYDINKQSYIHITISQTKPVKYFERAKFRDADFKFLLN